MKLQDLFPGSFRAAHFAEPQTFTIKGITPIVFEENGEEQQKGKMTFAEVSSYWVFGKEAASELAEQFGSDETDDWVGHSITLRKDRTRFKGEMVDCIRGAFAESNRRPMGVRELPAEREREPSIEDLERMLEEKRAAAEAKPARSSEPQAVTAKR